MYKYSTDVNVYEINGTIIQYQFRKKKLEN